MRSLSSGLAAKDDDGINCDEAELVGHAIQETLDNLPYTESTISTNKKIKSLIVLTRGVKVNNGVVYVDPMVLFMRLIILAERSEDSATYFNYELTPYPTSLFKDYFMRHPNKALLAVALKGELPKKAIKRKET